MKATLRIEYLAILLMFFFATCKRGKLKANIDITGEWAMTASQATLKCHYINQGIDSIYVMGEIPEDVLIYNKNGELFIDIEPVFGIANMNMMYRKFKKGERVPFFDTVIAGNRLHFKKGFIEDENTIRFRFVYTEYFTSVIYTRNYVILNGVQEVTLKRK